MIQEGQIVLFKFPQTDLPSGKLRPALVIRKLPGRFDDWLISMISSQLSQRLENFDVIVSVLCTDFLAICAFLSQELLSISLVDIFSWDHIRDQPDQIVDYLSNVLSQVSESGRLALKEAGVLWAAENLSQHVFLCFNCGARAVSADRNICMACGTEGTEEIATLIEELEVLSREIAKAKERGR